MCQRQGQSGFVEPIGGAWAEVFGERYQGRWIDGQVAVRIRVHIIKGYQSFQSPLVIRLDEILPGTYYT